MQSTQKIPTVSVLNLIRTLKHSQVLLAEQLEGVATSVNEVGVKLQKGHYTLDISNIQQAGDLKLLFRRSETEVICIELSDGELMIGIPQGIFVSNVVLSSRDQQPFKQDLATDRLGVWWKTEDGTLNKNCAGDMELKGAIYKVGSNILFLDSEHKSLWLLQ